MWESLLPMLRGMFGGGSAGTGGGALGGLFSGAANALNAKMAPMGAPPASPQAPAAQTQNAATQIAQLWNALQNRGTSQTANEQTLAQLLARSYPGQSNVGGGFTINP